MTARANRAATQPARSGRETSQLGRWSVPGERCTKQGTQQQEHHRAPEAHQDEQSWATRGQVGPRPTKPGRACRLRPSRCAERRTWGIKRTVRSPTTTFWLDDARLVN